MFNRVFYNQLHNTNTQGGFGSTFCLDVAVTPVLSLAGTPPRGPSNSASGQPTGNLGTLSGETKS